MNGSLGITGKLSDLALRAVRRRRRPIGVDLDPPSGEEDSPEGFGDLPEAQRRALRSLGGSTARSLAIELRQRREESDLHARSARKGLENAIGRLVRRLQATAHRLQALSLLPLVLLVDDQPAILRVFERYVESAGWRYASRSSFSEVEASLAKGLKPDLVVTDISLGKGETGVAIERLVKRELPDTPVLFVSGYGDVRTMTSPVLDKSCGKDEFVKKARELMRLEARGLRSESSGLTPQASGLKPHQRS